MIGESPDINPYAAPADDESLLTDHDSSTRPISRLVQGYQSLSPMSTSSWSSLRSMDY